MFLPRASGYNNCFELLGFDILIDEDLKLWLLEINLTPSLVPENELDFNIKSNLVADLFSLTGINNIHYKHQQSTNKHDPYKNIKEGDHILKKNFLKQKGKIFGNKRSIELVTMNTP